MLRILFVISALFLLCPFLGAQSGIDATLKFDNTEVLIGDQLRGFIIVNTPQGKEVSFPVVTEYWKEKNLEVFNLSNPEKSNVNNGKQILKQAVSLIFWDTGSYKLPALPFVFVNGAEMDTVYAEGISIKVSYPDGITGDSTYLAPIKPILEESKTFWDYLLDFQYAFYGLLALLLIAALIYVFLRIQKAALERRGRLSPEAKALDALQKLLDAEHIQKGNFGTYHEGISWIVREYLQDRFGIRALESITVQILEKVGNEQMTDVLKTELKEVLETADLVKYAKASPLPAANDFAAAYIRKLVEYVLQKQQEAQNNKK